MPTQCIAVDSPTKTYLCTRKFLVTHNTGKPKSDHDQLKLFAVAAFAMFPQLSSVSTGYVWLAHNRVESKRFDRSEAPIIWQEFLPRVRRMEKAACNDSFVPKPSGLCRNWCPVTRAHCEFSGKA